MRTAFLCSCASIWLNPRRSLSKIPAKSSFRMLSNTDATSSAARFPFAVGLMIENLRLRRSILRVSKRLASRRSINRVIFPGSLPRAAASCPGVTFRASTQRSRTLASCAVIPNLRKRRSSDVCSLMHVRKSQDTRRSLRHSGADDLSGVAEREIGSKKLAAFPLRFIWACLPIFPA
jgi:hypothetical protein